MLLEFNYLKQKYNMNITGIVHIGAHFGEEVPIYLENGISKIVCFEPIAENISVLRQYENDIEIVPVALGHKRGIADIFISSNAAESSSILRPKKHLIQYPHITFDSMRRVTVERLSSYADQISGCNFMNVDVQGFEYQVFLGASKVLDQFDYIYTEVNRDETYENNFLVNQIDEYLYKFGFSRVETDWSGGIWGDALYVRKAD